MNELSNKLSTIKIFKTIKSKFPKKNIAFLVLIILVLVAVSINLFIDLQTMQEREKSKKESRWNTHGNIVEESLNLKYWKKFESENFPFTFFYRADLVIEERKNRLDIGDSYLSRLDMNEYYDFLFWTYLTVEDNLENHSLEEYVEKILCVNKYTEYADTRDSCQEIANKYLTVFSSGSIKGLKTKYNYYENTSDVYLFKNNNKIISIHTSGETGGSASELAIKTIELMISTFKFIN